MPIIVPEGCSGDRLYSNLSEEAVPLLREEEAASRDIRPARIGLLNLMPAEAMQATETQWLRWMGQSVLQIEPVLMKFDGDRREASGASRQEILADYLPFSRVADAGLDGLVVTGDNQEIEKHEGFSSGKSPREFEDLMYEKQLREVVDWARDNVGTTIYSCLGGHFALHHLYNLERKVDVDKKTFGVYRHDVVDEDSPFVRDMNSVIISPHSRWGNISVEEMERINELKVLAISQRVGWLLATSPNHAGGADLFVQGHPEYFKRDLDAEYRRDRENGQEVPQSYYEEDDPAKPIEHSWRTDARALHGNVIAEIYERISREDA